MRLLLFILLIISNFQNAYSQNQIKEHYTIKDLEVLEENNRYDEFFKHIFDIKPSARDKTWQDMVTSMTDRYITKLLSKRNIGESEYRTVIDIAKLKHNLNDELFSNKRDQLFIKLLSQKIESRIEVSQIKDFANDYFIEFGEKAEIGIKIANSIIDYEQELPTPIDYTLYWPYISPMVASKFSEFYCNKKNIMKTLVYKFYNLELKSINSLIHEDCLVALKKHSPVFLNDFNINLRKRTFKLLSNLQELKPRDKAFFHTLELLNGHQFKDDQWDSVFEALNYLEENYKDREILIAKIKSQDPLPDWLFKVHKASTIKSLAKMLSKKFPEYIDLYANYCIKYLKGDGDFPRGNPTPHCDTFMISIKSIKSTTTDALYKRYEMALNSWKKGEDK